MPSLFATSHLTFNAALTQHSQVNAQQACITVRTAGSMSVMKLAGFVVQAYVTTLLKTPMSV